MVACNKDEVITITPAPEITFGESAYALKVGGSVVLQPTIKNIDKDATYLWKEGSTTLATTSSYTYTATKVGTFYISLTVTTPSGSDSEEVRIEVEELRPPVIGFAAEGNVMTIEVGVPTTIVPDIFSPTEYSLEWILDGKSLSGEKSLEVNFSAAGSHELTLRATNEDGTTERKITLEAVAMLDGKICMPAERHTSLGRTLLLDAATVGFTNPAYTWSMGGKVVATTQFFAYTPSEEGTEEIKLEVSDGKGRHASRITPIHTHPAEGHFKRAATAESKATASKVFEYSPAPGQFINESKSGFGTITSAAEAATYAEGRLASEKYVSLGGWGGYMVAGFDHSVERGEEGYDFSITGNMYTTSSEPGIVFVMQDTNGNGLPDDEWYELRGSEWGSENHSTRYAVTYFRPVGDAMSVHWVDNRGERGVVPYMSVHSQPSYYPQWFEGESVTFYGSRLEMNTQTDSSGKVWHLPYAWGYADNLGEDCEAIGESEAVRCRFDIDNAVAVDGSAVELQYVDFVKIQCAVNGVDKAMGELSTEILAIECVR